MDLTKDNIERWMYKMYPGTHIVKLDVTSGEEFELICRCWHGDIPMDQFCKIFVDRFSVFSLTNWTVCSTYPRLQKLLYRRLYSCQATSKNKNQRRETTKRNKDCRAKLDIRFKKMSPYTLRTDKFLKMGLNVIIKINFNHSHSVRSAEWLSLLRCTSTTKDRYNNFFDMGIPTTDVKLFNEMYIRLAYYDSKLREIQLANAMINVAPTKLHHLQHNWKKLHREFKFDSMARLRKEKKLLESKGFFLKIIDNPKIIVVLTPLTKKVFEKYSTEIIIDSSGIEGKEIHYVTSVFVPTNVGALPIGYVIHNGPNEEEYEQGFKALASSLNEFCEKPLRPKTVMTNDGDQLEELSRFFPTSSVDLCSFANLTQFWTWIWNANNNVNEEDRKRLMSNYYKVMTAHTSKECEDVFRELITDSKFTENPCLVQLFNGLWSVKEKSGAESSKCKIGNEEKLISVHMRVYKSIVVRRIQKFNPYVIVKLLTDVVEGMYKRYLSQFLAKKPIFYPLFSVFYDKPGDFSIIPLGEKEYMVQSLTELDQVCTVYTDIMFCTCSSPTGGRNGIYCIHLRAIESDFPFLVYPKIEESDKEFYKFPDLEEELQNAINMFEKSDDFSFAMKPDSLKEIQTSNVRHKTRVKLKDLPPEITSMIQSPGNTDNEGAHTYDDDTFGTIDDESLSEAESEQSIIKAKANKKIKKLVEIEIKSEIKHSRKRRKPSSSDDEPLHVPSKSKTDASSQDEEHEIVSKGWGMIYKNLPPQQRLFAKKAIDDILFEATLGTLGRNSIIIKPDNDDNDDPIDTDVKNEFYFD